MSRCDERGSEFFLNQPFCETCVKERKISLKAKLLSCCLSRNISFISYMPIKLKRYQVIFSINQKLDFSFYFQHSYSCLVRLFVKGNQIILLRVLFFSVEMKFIDKISEFNGMNSLLNVSIECHSFFFFIEKRILLNFLDVSILFVICWSCRKNLITHN